MGWLQVAQHSPVDGFLGVSPAAIVVHNAVALEAPAVASIQAAGCHALVCHTAIVAVSLLYPGVYE